MTDRKQIPLSSDRKATVAAIEEAGQHLLDILALHPGRETSIARTKTEEAVMWAVKGLTK